MTKYTEAVDIIYGVFKDVWDNESKAILGYTPLVEYDEPYTGTHASLHKCFARLQIRNYSDDLIGFGSTDMYQTSGLLMVIIFVPKNLNNGVLTGRQLSEIIKRGYVATSNKNGVLYNNTIIRESTPDERWRQFNVNIEYKFIHKN